MREFKIIEILYNASDITCVNGIPAGHDSTSSWCANMLHIIVVKNNSTVCQPIQVWSWNLL